MRQIADAISSLGSLSDFVQACAVLGMLIYIHTVRSAIVREAKREAKADKEGNALLKGLLRKGVSVAKKKTKTKPIKPKY